MIPPAGAAADAGAPRAADSVRSVYVHAPFCARRCGYCDFAVQVRSRADHREWAEAVAGERRLVAEEGVFELADALDTLYVGGGTPSLLGPRAMAALAGVIGGHRLEGPGLEWTAEANPESFTPEVAAGWRDAGVNRVSLGVQSFHEPTLRWMGRLHGAEGARRAVEVARGAGLEELSVDLMFGLPEDTGRSWREDLDRVAGLGVPHVSLYGLTVEAGTPLGRAVEAGRIAPPPDERYREEYLEAVGRLTAAGFVHYEVSNFALPGHESRHNGAYWSGDAYLGLGNGAHGYLHPLRRWNLRDWGAYQNAVREGRLPVAGEERLDRASHRLERIWLGLRTRRGLRLDSLEPAAREIARSWARRGLATLGDRVCLTAEGWLLMDRLTVELDGCLGDAVEADVAGPA